MSSPNFPSNYYDNEDCQMHVAEAAVLRGALGEDEAKEAVIEDLRL